jgi:hypothetical protein
LGRHRFPLGSVKQAIGKMVQEKKPPTEPGRENSEYRNHTFHHLSEPTTQVVLRKKLDFE